MKRLMLKQAMVLFLLMASVTWCSAKPTGGKTDALRRYEIDIFGPSAETAVKQAAVHAVRSAVGEFYCSDEMLLARSLLNRYIDTYYERFIASQKILSRRESQGLVYLQVAVVVDTGILNKDLREKRFFYKPRRRPFVYATVAETVDGTPAAGEPIAREPIHESLQSLLMPYTTSVIYSRNANIDLTQDEQHMEGARVAAQRAGVEVLVTGRVDLAQTRKKWIHFDEYTFYNAKASLTLIRVDDGKVLASAAYEAEAGNPNPQDAKRVAAGRATARILEQLIPPFAERWERTMTDNAAFQVLVVGVNEAEAGVVQERLATRLKGVSVYRRSLFEDVAVFNLYYPPGKPRTGEREKVESVLRDMVSPRFKILPTEIEKKIHATRVS